MRLRALWPAVLIALILSVGIFPDQWNLLLGTGGTSVYGTAETAVFAPQTPGADSVGFAGAQGFGAAATTDCVKDTVIVNQVTDLSLGGTGTLDSAFNHQHGDTLTVVVFRTGGWTKVLYEGQVNCLVVAGQTAPGGGIGITGRAVDVGSHARFLRVTGGKDFIFSGLTMTSVPQDDDSSTPTCTVEDMERMIWYQIQTAWTIEKACTFATSNNADTILDVTVQRSMLSEPNRIESTLIQVSEHPTNPGRVDRTSWIDNAFVSSSHRNALVATNPSSVHRFRGNVWYNNLQARLHARSGHITAQDLFCKDGPASDSRFNHCFSVDLLGAESDDRYFVDDVIGEYSVSPDTTADSLWVTDGTFQEVSLYYQNQNDIHTDPRDSLGADVKLDTASTAATFEPALRGPQTVYNTLVRDSAIGDYRRIDGSGDWEIRVDSMLSEVLDDVRDGTGPPDLTRFGTIDSAYIAARWRYPKATGTAPNDADSDGLPDAFEKVATGDSNDSTSATPQGDPDSDGFVNVIEYAFGTNPAEATAADGSESTPVATYGGERFILKAPVTQVDTFCPTAGGCPASDTIFTARPDEDTIVPSEVQCAAYWYRSDTTEALCVAFSTDTPTTQTGLLDSATADSICADASWDCTPAALKAVTIAQSVLRGFFALRSEGWQ